MDTTKLNLSDIQQKIDSIISNLEYAREFARINEVWNVYHRIDFALYKLESLSDIILK